jgi:hypothetical protein
MPTLVISQRGGQDHNTRIILAGVPSAERSVVTHVRVADSNHIFTWGGARDAVIEAVGAWATKVAPMQHFVDPPTPVVAASGNPVVARP